MKKRLLFLPALAIAGAAAAQGEYRSAFEGFRSFAAEEVRDWRKANEEVGAAGGHAGHKSAQDPGTRPVVPELLAKPLGPAEAVQIALGSNPAPQAAHHTRKAWFQAVAATELATYMAQAQKSAEASAELARRMAAVGNMPRLAQAHAQIFYAEATAQLARARHNATAARERLARLVSLPGEELAHRLPDRLPGLPHAVDGARATALQERSDVREAYQAYRTAFDIARHYRDEIVPLRKQISEEVLLRYNGMLTSVFELLADSRQQAAAAQASIEALRDFWLAEADLQLALAAGGR
jgi:outer membrane protein TolC